MPRTYFADRASTSKRCAITVTNTGKKIMSTNFRYLAVVIFLFAFQGTAVAEEKVVPLFNGRDLAGWTYHLSDPDVKMEDVWSAKDGVLKCKGKPSGYLLTKKNDYENYVLELEWRWPEKGGNNGVLVHVTK